MSDLVTPTDEEAYADFAKRYGPARSDYDLARILSGRLRDLDKRTRAANKRADALERENAELREANRKLHRRCQQAERVHAMTVGYLSTWLNYLKERAGKKKPDRILFRWAIQDLHRKANLASRALPSDAKERKE